MLGISKSVPNETALREALEEGIEGTVLLDQVSRGLYSTDASIYQIDPIAVVIPKTVDDVKHAIKVAREMKLPLLPRGGGTSLAGQTVGAAIVLDFSKNLNRILEVNEAEHWVRVEPGVVRDVLNVELKPAGLHLGPETATTSRANVGGMIGNNSSGTRSILYGKTVDHVIELKVILATGEELHLKPVSQDEWKAIGSGEGREAELYRAVGDIVSTNRDEIVKRFPKVMRRVSGYNLDAFPEEGDWNLSHLVVGSEGTLATVIEAKLNLVPLPASTCMCVVHFRKINEALRAVEEIVKHGPAMVEVLDKTIITMARENLGTRPFTHWVEGDPSIVLVVDFYGETPEEAEDKIDKLIRELQSTGFGYAHPKMNTPKLMSDVLTVRLKGLGLLLGIKGDAKPLAFIEDSSVPLNVLPDYIEEVEAFCKGVGVEVAMYAHASVGLLHVRPILNLKNAEDVEKMKQISAGAFELVKKYGGSWSGEHGDGLVRSYKNKELFGDQLYEAFIEVKRLFDPDGLMNPGKIVEAKPMDENLRIGPQYHAQPVKTWFNYREDGGFDRAVEMCTGVGECRKVLGGTMCPSFRATREEQDTVRGRANALRLAMTNQLGFEGMSSDAVRETLDLCLGCKACKAECPSNVDMAKLKVEYLASYHKKRGSKVGEKFFAKSPLMAHRFSGSMAPIVNWSSKNGIVRKGMEAVLGLDARRPLPEFTKDPFPDWFEGHAPSADTDKSRPQVVLFDDTFMNHHEPSIGRSSVRVLEKLGYRVQLAKAGCCGRTLISHGFLEEAKAIGTRTLQKLNGYLLDGLPVLVAEPSCLSALTDDLPDLVDNVDLGRRVHDGVISIEEFLRREIKSGKLSSEDFKKSDGGNGNGKGGGEDILIHGHCHQKSLYETQAMKDVFAECTAGEVSEVDSGCCGMAGSFGYWKKHYDVSEQIAEDRLMPAVRAADESTNVVACGFSCRHQISDFTGRKSRHFIEVLAEMMGLEQ